MLRKELLDNKKKDKIQKYFSIIKLETVAQNDSINKYASIFSEDKSTK